MNLKDMKETFTHNYYKVLVWIHYNWYIFTRSLHQIT